jgi:GGDEF domain-containing protein
MPSAEGILNELVEAIQTLLQVTSREDPLFLAHGLELLVQHLRADQAFLVIQDGPVFRTQWWLPERSGEPAPVPVPSLSAWLVENPHRTLLLRNIPKDGRWKEDPGLKALGLHAVAGTTLQVGGVLKGMVFLHYSESHEFTRAELAILGAVTSYLGRILEIENLKTALRDLENSLAITRAVVEDSSIQDLATDLPNLRYLEIWMKANLVAAAREPDVMTVAMWSLDLAQTEDVKRVREVADRIRGGDLLVSMGHGQFLLVLQRTPKGLGQVFLTRLRQKLGPLPMGATVWVPGSDDVRLESARKRLEVALGESQTLKEPRLVWRMPEMGNGS